MRNVTQFKPRHCFLYITIQIRYCRYDTLQQMHDLFQKIFRRNMTFTEKMLLFKTYNS